MAFAPEEAKMYRPPGWIKPNLPLEINSILESKILSNDGKQITCIIDAWYGNLTEDTQPEYVICFVNKYNNHGGIAIIETADTGLNILAFLERPDYYPFRVSVGDVDNDGTSEIVAGIFRPAKHQPTQFMMDVYIFSLRHDKIQTKWATQSNPYSDLRVVFLGGEWKFLFLKQDKKSSQIGVYTWNGFNFWLDQKFLFNAKVQMGDVMGEPVVQIPGGRCLKIIKDKETYKLISSLEALK